MPKPIIAVDIDDVLSYSASGIVEYSNQRWGHSHTVDDFQEDMASMWGVEHDEAEQRWHEYMTSGHMAQYTAIPDARQALEKLKSKYRLVALTSRRKVLVDLTKQWLDEHYPGVIDEVVHAGIYGENRPDAHKLTKGEMLRQIGAAYLIDDQPKHCIGAIEAGVPAILFGDYSWSKAEKLPKSITRCRDWAGVLEYFDGR